VDDEDPGQPRMVPAGTAATCLPAPLAGMRPSTTPATTRVTCPSRAGYRTGRPAALEP